VVTAVVVAAVLAAATLVVERPAVEVRVTAARGGRVLSIGVTPGDLVELRYRHSVERTPITEVFRAERDGLWFVEMRFVSQGAGLPTEGYVKEGDHFVLRQPRRVGVLPLLLSSAAGHRLWSENREVDLVGEFGDGAGVTISSSAGPWRLRVPGRR
jgi:hypothetical protein